MTLDFTLEKYTQLCEAIRGLGCPVRTMRDFLEAGQPEGLSVVLRHDVDRRMGAALRMAQVEADYGIAATYYVRTTPAVFKPEALRQLHQLGHEVGYHYEVLAKAKGNQKQAIALFEQELKRFREIVPLKTISMHGSPLSPWNNLDLWQTYDPTDYGVVGDAVLSVASHNLHYFTDTGRSWEADKHNLRDCMRSRAVARAVRRTNDLIDFLEGTPDCPVYISAHPNRWAANPFERTLSAVSDWAVNWAKQAVALLPDHQD